MVDYLRDERIDRFIPYRTERQTWKPRGGNGYLAGSFPDGITTVDGVPVGAIVRVLYRPASGRTGDGVVVSEVQSAPDGTWRVDGLDTSLKFDVVGRKDGYNDVIVADVSPAV